MKALRPRRSPGGVPTRRTASPRRRRVPGPSADGLSSSSRSRFLSVGVLGTGAYLPEQIVDNRTLALQFGCEEEWITRRTGILERRFAREGQGASDLGARAALAALRAANVDPGDVDLVICATYTPDYSFPSTACLIQQAIGAKRAAAFDLQAACSGFVYAFITGAQFIATRLYTRVLIVAAEVNSTVMDMTDRKVSALFGDGAGAALIGPSEDGSRVLSQVMGADGSGGNLFWRPAGGSKMPPSARTIAERLHYIRMDGKALFRWGIEAMIRSAREALDHARLAVSDIDLFIPHQANLRMILAGLERLGIPREKTLVNLDRYANTSAATIPIALHEAVETGRLSRGKKVLLTGFGAGLTWASVVIRW